MEGKLRLFKIIGIGIFVFILFKINFSQFVGIWHKIDIVFVLAGLFFVVVEIIVRAAKWMYLLRFFSIPIPFGQSVTVFWVGLFIGMVTPGKLGDILKVYFLDVAENSRLRALLSVVLERVTDFIILAVVGLASALAVFEWNANFSKSLFIMLLFGTVLLFVIKQKHYLKDLIQKALSKYAPLLADQFQKLSVKHMLSDWQGADKRLLYVVVILLLFCWFVYFVSRYFLMLSLHITLSFLDMTACVALSTIFALLPISVSGIGTRDVSMIYLFSFYGLTAEQAIAFSIIILITDSVIVSFGYIPYHFLCSRFGINLKNDSAKIKNWFQKTELS